MSTEPAREKPVFFQAVVGVRVDKAKLLSPADMEALCSAFQCLTNLDPLSDVGGSVNDMWQGFLDYAGANRGGHGVRMMQVHVPKK